MIDKDAVYQLIISGGIWNTDSIEVEPEVRLSEWSVRQIKPDNTLHFVGWNIGYREGRVSSAIVDFDPVRMVGRTKSGRVYQLEGAPGHDRDAEYVWQRWVGIQGNVESWEVVTVEEIKP